MPATDTNGENADEALTRELIARGLEVRPRPEGGLIVRNLSSHSEGLINERELSHLLRQEVVCQHASGELWWFWVWAGLERGDPPDLEPLCPAGEVERAAERIARVLAVPSVRAGAGS